MQAKDLIYVNLTGTNGQSRNTKTITEKFNGLGESIDVNGNPSGRADRLRNLPTGKVALPPDFPQDEFTGARLRGDVREMKRLQLAYGEQLAKWQASQEGGTEPVQVAKSVLGYAKEFHQFSENDRADAYILKMDNIDVNVTKLDDGRTLFTVSGTAVFGK